MSKSKNDTIIEFESFEKLCNHFMPPYFPMGRPQSDKFYSIKTTGGKDYYDNKIYAGDFVMYIEVVPGSAFSWVKVNNDAALKVIHLNEVIGG